MLLIFPTMSFMSPWQGQNKLNSNFHFICCLQVSTNYSNTTSKAQKYPYKEENSTLKSIVYSFAALKLWWCDPIDLHSKINGVIIELQPCLTPSESKNQGVVIFPKCLEICRAILIYQSWEYEPISYNGHSNLKTLLKSGTGILLLLITAHSLVMALSVTSEPGWFSCISISVVRNERIWKTQWVCRWVLLHDDITLCHLVASKDLRDFSKFSTRHTQKNLLVLKPIYT